MTDKNEILGHARGAATLLAEAVAKLDAVWHDGGLMLSEHEHAVLTEQIKNCGRDLKALNGFVTMFSGVRKAREEIAG